MNYEHVRTICTIYMYFLLCFSSLLSLSLFLSLAPPLPPLNRTASPSLPLPHHISPTSSSTAFSVATMRNPDLISKGKKVKGTGSRADFNSYLLSPSPFPPQERFSDDTSITTSSTSKSSSVSPRKIPRSTAELANNKYSFPGNYGRFSCSTCTCTLIPCVYGFIF